MIALEVGRILFGNDIASMRGPISGIHSLNFRFEMVSNIYLMFTPDPWENGASTYFQMG